LTRRHLLGLLVVLLAAEVLGLAVGFVKSGGCDRDPPDEPVPACQPGDETCKVGAPAGPVPKDLSNGTGGGTG